MFRASLVQALSVWSDLEAALRGEHGFGGHVAEIYVYRLASRCPSAEREEREGPTLSLRGWRSDSLRAATRGANEDLHDLLAHFSETRDARIEIATCGEGERAVFAEFGPWFKGCGEEHRWHVRVEPRDFIGLVTVPREVQFGARKKRRPARSPSAEQARLGEEKVMERMERIDKSVFRKGYYVGYGSNGATYRLHKDSSSGYWLAIIHAGDMSAKPNSFYSKTLAEADKKLGKL